MQPFEVRLDYEGRSWCSVKFEIGHNEIGDAEEPEYRLSADLANLFVEVGVESPKPVRVMSADHQIAQKLHAVSAEASERARDLVDLQLLDRGEDLDLVQVRATCTRLFKYRGQQTWPPTITAGDRWNTLYEDAVEGLEVVPTVAAAVDWINEFARRIAVDGN